MDKSSKQYYSLMITAMDPIEDKSASADGDCEEEDNYNESPSLESCDSDSECESKNNHKRRHENEDQDHQPIIEGYNRTEIWNEDEILIFPTFFQTSDTRSTEDNFTFTVYKRADKKIHQKPFLKKPEFAIQFQRIHC
jgi:hypothetical protein